MRSIDEAPDQEFADERNAERKRVLDHLSLRLNGFCEMLSMLDAGGPFAKTIGELQQADSATRLESLRYSVEIGACTPDDALLIQAALHTYDRDRERQLAVVVASGGNTTTVGIRCTCPAHACCSHSVAALCAWAAVYQPAADLPWMTGADVFAEERREEMMAGFVEKQTEVWGVGWRATASAVSHHPR